jgi:O-antigen/teichoic acid export membrane protein
LVGQVFGKGLRLGFRFFVIRMLDAHAYGQIVLLISCSELAARAGMLGFDRIALKHGAEVSKPDQAPAWVDLTRFCLLGSALGGLLAGVALYLLSPWLAQRFGTPELAPLLAITALGVPGLALGGVATSALQSIQRMRPYALWGFVMAYALACALLLPVWAFDLGLRGAAAAIALGATLAGLGAASHALRARKAASPLPRQPRGPMLRFGATMLLYMGAAQLVQQLDRLMLGAFMTPEDVGVYDIAALLASHIPIFLMAFNAIVFPRIGAAYRAGHHDEVRSLFQLETRWVILLSAPTFLALTLLRDPIMAFFGPEFAPGAQVTAILSLAQLLNAGVGPVGGVLIMTGHERQVLYNTLFLGALNAVGNWLLIPRFGVLGAALSTASSIAAWNLVSLLQVWLTLKVQPYNRASAKLALVALVALALGLALDAALPPPWGPWLAAAAGLLAYAGLAYRFALQPEDYQIKDLLLQRLARR